MTRKFVLAFLIYTLHAVAQIPASTDAPPDTGTVAASPTAAPPHFMALGAGFQATSLPKVSGWINFCNKVSGRVYACGATDYTGTTSSARAGVETIVFQTGIFTLLAKGDAGVSTGAGASLGAAFGAGGTAVVDISKFIKVQNIFAVASVAWLKENVQDLQSGGGLAAFGQKTAFRFGFGRAF